MYAILTVFFVSKSFSCFSLFPHYEIFLFISFIEKISIDLDEVIFSKYSTIIIKVLPNFHCDVYKSAGLLGQIVYIYWLKRTNLQIKYKNTIGTTDIIYQ